MNKSHLSVLGMYLAMSEMNDVYEITERGKVSKSKATTKVLSAPKKPFHEQDGIKRLISDYNEIKSGTSKKGVLKKNRIIEKVEYYLKNGMLKEEHLTQQGTALKP